ncbi:MAG: N-acetylneuraminate synthase family protein, partial [Planctomycetota bacterium]
MRIGANTIDQRSPCFVIAEIGVNHDGDGDRCIELIEAAATAGADAVKLQLFRAELLLSKAARLAEYQRDAGETDPFAMLQRLELNEEAMQSAIERSHALGLSAIASIFSLESVDTAERLGFNAYKTASPDIVNRPLLEALMATGKPMIVSTGTASIEEIRESSSWIVSADAVYLHCVSAYPTPDNEASLQAMSAVKDASGRNVVGYSDHTTSEFTGAVAAGAGAKVLEKHLSYNRSAPGPDHAASLDPDGLARYISNVRIAESMLGDADKTCRAIEGEVRSASRQSIVAARQLPP